MALSLRSKTGLRAVSLLGALCLVGGVAAQNLNQFQPQEAPGERLAINRAIRQCVRMIQDKTVNARVSLKGPCRKASGDWAGVEKLDGGFRLRFSVRPADASDGTLLSAIQGDAVRVFCSADAQGTVSGFEDVKESIGESFRSTNLCWPAGD